MKTVYIKTADWQQLFDQVKLQAFTLGLEEFYSFLTKASVDEHGRIRADFWNDTLFDYLDQGNKMMYKEMEKQGKVIVKQARQLGLTAAYNDLGRLHLRELA